MTMIGFYAADAPVSSYPCKVLQDDDNSLGDPHAHMTMTITTPKGDQTVKIDGTPAGMTATQVPDLGNNYPFPPVWAVAPPAATMMLVNNDGSATKVIIRISGVECAMTINNSPQNCGLSYLVRWLFRGVGAGPPGGSGLCELPPEPELRQDLGGPVGTGAPSGGLPGHLRRSGFEIRLTET